jgi:hypothetical protein
MWFAFVLIAIAFGLILSTIERFFIEGMAPHRLVYGGIPIDARSLLEEEPYDNAMYPNIESIIWTS